MDKLIETDEVKLRTLTQDGDSLRLRVPVLQAGVKNLNKRTYSLGVIKQAIQELKGRLSKRSTFGSTSHVKDMELDQVSHVVEDVELDEKGVAHAVLKILNTTKGKNLAAIIKGGGAVGISARGTGDVDKDGNVKEGYKLLGIDFTLSPSFGFRANKAMVFESLQTEENDGAVTLEELEKFGLEPLEPVKEDILRQRYESAVRLAGYKGTFASYKKLFEKG